MLIVVVVVVVVLVVMVVVAAAANLIVVVVVVVVGSSVELDVSNDFQGLVLVISPTVVLVGTLEIDKLTVDSVVESSCVV